MTSSSSLYGSSQTTGATSSSNFTTLYSGGSGPAPQGNLVIPGTLTVNGCAILTNCTSFSLLPTNAESILFGGASTSMSIGSGTGTTTINNQLATANYTFPVADGANGQVLVTDGSGTLSFAAVTTVGKTYNIDATATTGGANFNLTSDIPTTDTVKFANGSNMSIVRTDANTITFTATDTNTTYTQDVSSTSGGANLNLTGSDSTVDPVKFAGGTNITVTATDANTITISTVADNIPDGTAKGQVLYWDGSSWTANNVITSAASANRLTAVYQNSTAGNSSALLLRKDYGATAYSSANNDGVGASYGLISNSQGLSNYGFVGFEYSATAPQFVVASSLDNFATNTQLLVVDSTGAAITGDLDVRGSNITNTTGNLALAPAAGSALTLTTDATGPVQSIRDTTATNVASRALTLKSHSTLTPVLGFGTALEYQVETDATTTKQAGYINVVSTDVTTGSEDFSMNFGLMQNGATYDDRLSLFSNGNLNMYNGGTFGIFGLSSGYTKLVAPSTGSNITYTLPGADGTSGYVLSTNGSGTLSWVANPDTNTTYTINSSTTTGGANFNLQGSDSTTDTIKFANGSNVTVTSTDANTITIAATDTNTTYDFNATSATGGANLNLVGSDSTTDTVKLTNGQHITATYTSATEVTLGSDATDANTVSTIVARDSSGNFSASGATLGNVTVGISTDQTISTTSGDLVLASATNTINASSASINAASLSVDNQSSIDTNTVTTTSTSTVTLMTTTRNAMTGLVNIIQGANVHCVNFTALRVDATTALLTTYAEMYNTTSLASFTADVSGGAVRLLITPSSATSTVFSAVRTSLT